MNFNGYYLLHGGESVIIDPPDLDETGMKELETLISENSTHPLKAILLTNVHHDRMSLGLKAKWSLPIYIHEKDRELLEFVPDATFQGGDTPVCGLKVIHLENQKSPGESAFLLEARKILIVGDALIGKIPGKVNLLPPDKYRDIRKAKEGLRILKDYDFESILVGDGEPILTRARQVVMEFLES